jgi:hypothetical protein
MEPGIDQTLHPLNGTNEFTRQKGWPSENGSEQWRSRGTPSK